MSENNRYVGVNEHPSGLDMPTGLSRRLSWDSEASASFAALSKEQQEMIIRHIRNSAGASDAEERITSAIGKLKN